MDVTYGNVSVEEAERLANAAGSVDDVPHEPGSTEPWVSRLVADFIIARGARTVLETGCFRGATSVFIYNALRRLGGGTYHACDLDPERMLATKSRLAGIASPVDDLIVCHLVTADILHYLERTTARFDAVWLDDDHSPAHVERELTQLYPLMNPGGIVMLHDVVGSTNLQSVLSRFGGYSVDLPRLGPGGGFGIVQIR